MKKVLLLSLLCFSVGCGLATPRDRSLPQAQGQCVQEFVNNTKLSTGTAADPMPSALDPQTSSLWALWRSAQQDLSTNPIPYLDGHTVPPVAQAASIEPNCQNVVAVPDLTPQELFNQTGDSRWLNHSTPTGVFMCSGSPVYGCFMGNTVYVADSLAYRSVYEMENAILCRLAMCGGR